MFPLQVRNDVVVRILQESDTNEVFQTVVTNRDYLRQWLPWAEVTKSREDTGAFIRNSLRDFGERKSVALGIWVGGIHAGGSGYHDHDWRNMKTEVGYWLAERYQGQGIMTDVVKAILPYAFSELGMNRVEIHCAIENRRSRAIPERLGFTMDGIMRGAHKLYDNYVDLAIYGLLRGEFKS